MSHGNRNRKWRRSGAQQHAQQHAQGGQGWAPPSEEYFGREPFTYGREPRYFGTGVPGYTSGPGYTGGVYGYGEELPEDPTELERAYAHEVYGYGPGTYEPVPPGDGRHHRPPVRKYPPGPKGYVRSDERIREEICEHIAAARHVDSSNVTVEVIGGKVLLDGTVPHRRMKHAIEDLADGCPGVQDIDNRIRVQDASATAGAE